MVVLGIRAGTGRHRSQLRSDEVNMVVACLRSVEYLHANVSFIADTELKDATDQGKSRSKIKMLTLLEFRPLSSTQIQSTNERLPMSSSPLST